MPIEIKTRYDDMSFEGISFPEPSLTQQHFKDDADINTIMRRYEKTGLLVDPTVNPTRKPFFGDYADSTSFHEAQTLIARNLELFDELPAEIRRRFSDSPEKLIEFVEDPNNFEEGVSLGLFTRNLDPVSGISESSDRELDEVKND